MSNRQTNFLAKLLDDETSEDGIVVPAGTIGRVVDVIQGNSVIVEFDEPKTTLHLWHSLVEVFRKG